MLITVLPDVTEVWDVVSNVVVSLFDVVVSVEVSVVVDINNVVVWGVEVVVVSEVDVVVDDCVVVEDWSEVES